MHTVPLPGGKNVGWSFEDGRFLVVDIMDLSQNYGVSSTGKTVTVASTCGHRNILQTGASLNLNAYLQLGTTFDDSGLTSFRPWKTNNIELNRERMTVRLKIDLSVEGVLASSGKVKLLACTNGNHQLGHSKVYVGCQVMAKPDVMVDLSCLRSDGPPAKRPRKSNHGPAEDRPERPPIHESAFTPHFFPNDPKSLPALLATLNEARSTLVIAIFMLTENQLAHLVMRKHREGVNVRVICDNDMDEETKTSDIDELVAAGIEVRRDHTKLHMHHKFAVIDSCIVVNGSFNWTGGAIRSNRENIVVSRCRPLAQAFQRQFEQLWKAFAPGRRPFISLSAAGSFQNGRAALFFPDKDDANLRIFLDELRSAKNSLEVCVFTLTLRDAVRVMQDLHRKGVRVRVISDDRCAAFRSGATKKELVDAGIGFRVDASPSNMHHKFAVVDGRTVINGSFNWTRQAENGNNENLIIYRNVPLLARAFQAEFESLWKEFAVHSVARP